MAGAAGEDKDVPEVMGAELAGPQMRLVGGENDRADAVSDAPGVEPRDGGRGEDMTQRGHGNGDQPAHNEIDRDPRPVREVFPD